MIIAKNVTDWLRISLRLLKRVLHANVNKTFYYTNEDV